MYLFSLQVIKNYSIEYRDIEQNSPWRTESSLKHDIVLLKLHPYAEYLVKVTAHTDRGPGQTSSVVFARTKSGSKSWSFTDHFISIKIINGAVNVLLEPKGPPENVRFVFTNDLLLATWDPPSDPNGNITGYSLQLNNEDSGNVSNLTSKVGWGEIHWAQYNGRSTDNDRPEMSVDRSFYQLASPHSFAEAHFVKIKWRIDWLIGIKGIIT